MNIGSQNDQNDPSFPRNDARRVSTKDWSTTYLVIVVIILYHTMLKKKGSHEKEDAWSC